MRSIHELMRLDGRVALVTGAGGHIGFAMAQALAEAGAALALADREGDRLEDHASQLRTATGREVSTHRLDLADEAAVRALPGEIAAGHGRLDILVNCAAFVGSTRLEGWAEPFERQGSAAWRMAMEVNITAVFELVQAATPLLRASGRGSIINVASIYGIVGPDWQLYAGTAMANPAAYGASKGALIQLTRWLATTLGPDIRVNCISPGGVARGQPGVFVQRYEERTPLKRMAREEDFKGSAVYLASDLSAYVTGQNLLVDGGWCTW